MEFLINFRQLLDTGLGDSSILSPCTYALHLCHGYTTCISLPSDSLCRLTGPFPNFINSGTLSQD